MYDILDETWAEGDYGMEPITIDLSSPEGFRALERRAADEVYNLYFHRDAEGNPSDAYNRLAGRSLDDVADSLARDLMQESVSLPRSAFADHERAGRELAIIRQVARYIYRQALVHNVRYDAALPGFTFPSGSTPLRPPARDRQPRTQQSGHK